MNWLDRAVGYVAPQAGLRRARHRAAMAALARSYEGARVGRRTEGWVVAGTSANAEIGTALAACVTARAIWCATTPMRRRRPTRWSATWSAPASCRGRGPAMLAVNETRPISSGPGSPKPAMPMA